MIHEEDHAYVKVTHQENVQNEMVGTQLLLRIQHKDGSYVPCMVLFSVCYEYIVSCYTVVDQAEQGAIRKISAHSAAMTKLVGSRKEEFERISRHHKAFYKNTWNPNILDLEPRVCMLLNRFTRNLGVMYASPSCELIFKVDPDQIVGKPFLIFIRADDLVSFVEQVDIAKSSTVVTHMRFWFQSPGFQHEIPCEAMLFGAADGMIAILRRCKPFTRRQLLTGGSEYFASESSVCSSYSSGFNNVSSKNTSFGSNSFNDYNHGNYNHDSSYNVRNSYNNGNRTYSRDFSRDSRHDYNSSYINNRSNYGTGSYCNSYNDSYNNSYSLEHNSSHHHPNYSNSNLSNNCHSNNNLSNNNHNHNNSNEHDWQNQRPQKVHNINSRHYNYVSNRAGSPTDSISSSYSSSASGSSMQQGTRVYRAPLRGVAMGSINSIRNLDKENNRLRPLKSLHEDESDIVDSETALPELYRLRKHHTQDSEVEDSELETGLETGIEELDLDGDGNFVFEEEEEFMEEGDEEMQMPPLRRRKEQQDWRGGHHHDMHMI
ncbi:hypothetical protein BGX27_009496 [Mortierella sp. AM989]|nr:hypothetical protein BGX27_009496 [Mortierella sp. AM989]